MGSRPCCLPELPLSVSRLPRSLADRVKSAKYQAERAKQESTSALFAVERFNTAPVAAPILMPMKACIDAVNYMPFRYHLSAAKRTICAEYAA